MDTLNTQTAQLTVPTTGAQTEVVDKLDTAEPTCSCPSQANTALTTDGFKNDETTAQQSEGVAAAPTEGDQRPKKIVEEGKPSEWYHGDDTPQGANEGGAQGKGDEAAQGDTE